MRHRYSGFLALGVALLLIAGCPTTGAPDGGAALDPPASRGMVPGTYIGAGTTTTTSSIAEPIETSGDTVVVISQDGTVTVDGAEYSVGKIVRDTWVTHQRLDLVKGVSLSSTSILINFDVTIQFANGLTFTGGGTIALRRIDDDSIEYTEQTLTFNTETATVIELTQKSSATLRR